MAAQLALLPDPIDEAFYVFHHANPHVYRALVALARRWKNAGHDRCSVNMLFEVLRFDDGLRTAAPDGLKLNNNFRSRYARIIQANERDLAGFFETRALRDERAGAA
jgi:hypothetical protein